MMLSPNTPAEREDLRRDCLAYRRRYNVPADQDIDVRFDSNDDVNYLVRDRKGHRTATAFMDGAP